MKLGILGYGHAARLYLAVLEGCRQEILRLADPSVAHRAEVGARSPGIVTTSSYEAVAVDPALDAVVIATPAAQRFDLAHAALEAGKHVLVEATAAFTAREAASLARLARHRERILLIAHPNLHSRGVARLRARLHDPASGALRLLSAGLSLMRASLRDPDLLWDLAAHEVARFGHLLGESPDWVQAREAAGIRGGPPARLSLTLGYPRGPMAHAEIDLEGDARVSELAARTAHGRVVLDDLNPVKSRVCIETDDRGAAVVEEVLAEDQLGELCQHFLRRIAAREPADEPLDEDVAWVLETARQAAAADASGRGHGKNGERSFGLP